MSMCIYHFTNQTQISFWDRFEDVATSMMTDAAVMDGLLLDLVSKHLAFDYVWAAASRDLYSEQSESQELFQRVYESNMLTLMSRPVLASPLLNFTIENDAIAAEFLYGADPE